MNISEMLFTVGLVNLGVGVIALLVDVLMLICSDYAKLKYKHPNVASDTCMASFNISAVLLISSIVFYYIGH